MTADTPPDWVLLEAAKRSGWGEYEHTAGLRVEYQMTRSAFRALCDMIHKHETPPVDPDLIEAREIVAEAYPSDETEIRSGEQDESADIAITLAGIKRGRELERGV